MKTFKRIEINYFYYLYIKIETYLSCEIISMQCMSDKSMKTY